MGMVKQEIANKRLAEVVRLRELGKSMREISAALKINVGSVSYYLNRDKPNDTFCITSYYKTNTI